MSFSNFVVFIALGFVALALFLGLWNMMRGGSANLSQNLMRWRVVLQFLAIIVLILVMLFAGRQG